jgi:hypothetical protein
LISFKGYWNIGKELSPALVLQLTNFLIKKQEGKSPYFCPLCPGNKGFKRSKLILHMNGHGVETDRENKRQYETHAVLNGLYFLFMVYVSLASSFIIGYF